MPTAANNLAQLSHGVSVIYKSAPLKSTPCPTTFASACIVRVQLPVSSNSHPMSSQCGSFGGDPLYPVAIILLFLTAIHPTCLRGQVALVAAFVAISRK